MDDEQQTAVKKMAELLRKGATMLAEACPKCGLPLMKVGETIYCATCDRRVVIGAAEDKDQSRAIKALIPQLRQTLTGKLQVLNSLLEKEDNMDALTRLANLMILLLQVLKELEDR
ncbi:MAG: hypothetical protein HXY34_00775 [Candidatus Thorarchaeota archaeon]|nr:hypothetical protein [Candidatus Thorarchaeota archaeon]